MCAPKKNGGIGLWDYADFNQALLAKQAWHMVTKPDSLCSRVLKARNFAEDDFWNARCPKRSSYTWRSILRPRSAEGSCLACWKWRAHRCVGPKLDTTLICEATTGLQAEYADDKGKRTLSTRGR
jgi:hypothetical protein